MIQIQQKKYDRQYLGQVRWKDAGGNGVWWWETGVGKTFAACDLYNRMAAKNSATDAMIVVPGDELGKQWKHSVNSFIPVIHHPLVRIITIHKLMDDFKMGFTYKCSLLILDELHEYYSDERIKIALGEVVERKYTLGLTANYEDINNRYKLIEPYLPVVDRIDGEEAIREGYISPYIEYNLGVDLTEIEKVKYKELTDKMTKNMKMFGRRGLEVANKVLQSIGKKDNKLVLQLAASNGWRSNLNPAIPQEAAILDMWAPGKIIGYASNTMTAIRERKNIVYNSMNKLRKAVEIITKFDDLKTICFSQSTVYADSLAIQINKYYEQSNPQLGKVCVAYHSGLNTIVDTDPVTGKQKKKGKTVLKREAIESIRTGKCRVISTASSLDRGFNVEDIELALTTSGTQNPTQYNQRKGRGLRIIEGKDKIALIINLYSRNTVDEQWLKTRQSKSNNVVYWVDNVDDINYSPKSNESFNIQEV